MSFRFVLSQNFVGVDRGGCEWQANNKVDRLWQKTPACGPATGRKRLGWMDIVERQRKDLANLAELAADVETGRLQDGFAARHGRLQPVPRGAG